jgi:hypothetical protein
VTASRTPPQQLERGLPSVIIPAHTKPQGPLRTPRLPIRTHRLLNLQGTPNGVQRAPKLNQEAVPGGLNDPPVMLANAGFDEVSLGGLEEP